MSYRYSNIELSPNLTNYIDMDGQPLKAISSLSKVNIFVGENNSGKSRFMRELFKHAITRFNIYEPDTSTYLKNLRELSQGVKDLFSSTAGAGVISFHMKGNTYGREISELIQDRYFDTSNEHYSKFVNFLKAVAEAPDLRDVGISSSRDHADIHQVILEVKNLLHRENSKYEFVKNFAIKPKEFAKVYIPILRSLNSFQKEINPSFDGLRHSFNNFLLKRVQNIYEFGNLDSTKHNVFTGQELYFIVKSMLLSERQEERDKIKRYQDFLSGAIYENREVLLIPNEDTQTLHVKIGKDERPIYFLGDGVQSLIMLTFPLMEYDNALFFIEEPELNLHPGMQRKFLDTLLSHELFKGKNHQYFITTHSNHFLDLTLDHTNIAIYKFITTEDAKKKVELVKPGDENLLRNLGVKNSAVFLSNATIWVEGITDRLYIKKFLELYQLHNPSLPRIYEDIDYSFVEYGGGNITHWSFLDSTLPTIYVDRLCAKAYLITDKDGSSKLSRQAQLRKKLGSRYKKLRCREIENILSLSTLERVIRSYPADKAFVLPSFPDEYPHKDVPIGEFIDKKLKPKNKYSAKSGALAAQKKLEFCVRATEGLSYQELTSLAKSLAKSVHSFVLEQKA